jgi:hypothetical protein
MSPTSVSYLAGILGYEERPLVSTDYVNDARSSHRGRGLHPGGGQDNGQDLRLVSSSSRRADR